MALKVLVGVNKQTIVTSTMRNLSARSVDARIEKYQVKEKSICMPDDDGDGDADVDHPHPHPPPHHQHHLSLLCLRLHH